MMEKPRLLKHTLLVALKLDFWKKMYGTWIHLWCYFSFLIFNIIFLLKLKDWGKMLFICDHICWSRLRTFWTILQWLNLRDIIPNFFFLQWRNQSMSEDMYGIVIQYTKILIFSLDMAVPQTVCVYWVP